MTTEQKHKIIDEMAIEFSLYQYQVEILKQILEFDSKPVYVVMARLNGRTMFKKMHYEMMNRIAEEELK